MTAWLGSIWVAMWLVYWVHPYTPQNMISLMIEVGLGFFIGDFIARKIWGNRHHR